MANDQASATPAVEVSAGLVFREERLLITQRHLDSHLGGLWEFPGGKRELGETFEECLHRELREELGIEVAILGLLESITHSYPEKRVRLLFFRCRWLRREPEALGCPAFRWIERPALSQYTFPAADARLLETLANTPALWEV